MLPYVPCCRIEVCVLKDWQIPWYRILEITIGCCIAIAIALAFRLQSPVSAGVIAILSIQDTKRATMRSSFERIAAYALAVLIAFICFNTLGYTVLAFGAYLLPFALVCYLVKIQASIPICTVLVSHFWIAGHMSAPLVLNSTYLMLLGSGIGTILSLFAPNSVMVIKRDQALIENSLQQTLANFAHVLRGSNQTSALSANLATLSGMLGAAQTKALTLLGNTLTRDVRYYVRYVDLRIAQTTILERMAETLTSQPYEPLPQAFPLADLLSHTASVLHETNDAVALLARVHTLLNDYRAEPLPQTRAEFEARALLYGMLLDVEQFLTLKKTFFQSLSNEERQRFFGYGDVAYAGANKRE